MSERLLVTGADGYLGRLLVRHHLAEAGVDRNLLLWTRAPDVRSALARMGGVVDEADLASGRVRFASGDLRSSDPFRDVDPGEVRAIVHLAAATSFTISAGQADAVNRDGTARVVDLARRCAGLESLCVASTIYASGLRVGPVPESELDGTPGFANEYERSKWEAELVVLTAGLSVPLAVVRLATVVADDAAGRVTEHNAVHNTLNLLRHGLLSLMPGEPSAPVYLITGAVAVQALAAAVESRAEGIFHVAHRSEDSLTLEEALDIAIEVFSRDPAFAGRRLRRPRFADLTSFGLLAEGASSFGSGVLGQALGSLLPFARQLYAGKHVENDRLRTLLPGYRPDDARDLFAGACAALLPEQEVAGAAS